MCVERKINNSFIYNSSFLCFTYILFGRRWFGSAKRERLPTLYSIPSRTTQRRKDDKSRRGIIDVSTSTSLILSHTRRIQYHVFTRTISNASTHKHIVLASNLFAWQAVRHSKRKKKENTCYSARWFSPSFHLFLARSLYRLSRLSRSINSIHAYTHSREALATRQPHTITCGYTPNTRTGTNRKKIKKQLLFTEQWYFLFLSTSAILM